MSLLKALLALSRALRPKHTQNELLGPLWAHFWPKAQKRLKIGLLGPLWAQFWPKAQKGSICVFWGTLDTFVAQGLKSLEIGLLVPLWAHF